MIGEIHGTEEAPFYMFQMICQALGKGMAVTVGLELPYEEQDGIVAFLQSAGRTADQEKLLSLPFWKRSYQDGRTSRAMYQLIENMRSKSYYKDRLRVILIDDPSTYERDVFMAKNVLSAVKTRPENVFFILTGNQHNIILEGTDHMGAIVAKEIGIENICSLQQRYTQGKAWICNGSGGCGESTVSGNGRNEVGIEIDYEPFEYHGFFDMGEVTASHPAITSLK